MRDPVAVCPSEYVSRFMRRARHKIDQKRAIEMEIDKARAEVMRQRFVDGETISDREIIMMLIACPEYATELRRPQCGVAHAPAMGRDAGT